MTTDAKIAKLEIRRSVARDQITRIQAFVDESGSKANTEQLELRLRFLDKYYEEFCDTQAQLELLVAEEFKSTNRADVEAIYFDIKPQLSVLIQQLRPSPLDTSGVTLEQSTKLSSSLKLRKIEVLMFNGDYTKWMEFHESFMSLVHNQENVDNITKFQYLRSSLGKVPYRTIESLELTAANYAVALKILSDRYENRKIICQEHIRSLLSFKTIDKGCAEKIRELIDHFNSHLRALESLQRPVKQWDDLIVTMIYNKLDHETRCKWDDESSADRMATLEELLTFLNKRCHTLESKGTVTTSKAIPSTSHYTRASAKPNRPNQFSHVSTKPQYQCTYCSTMGHSIFRCTKFLSLLPDVLYQEAMKRKLCMNCLKNEHITSECNSNDSCKRCNSKHHTLLHQFPVAAGGGSNTAVAILSKVIQEKPLQVTKSPIHESTTGAPILKPNQNGQQTSLLSARKSASYVYLATAIVKVLDKSNKWIFCRGLLDSVSQLNFITEAFAARLGLKMTQGRTTISGVGESTACSAWKSTVILQSCHSSYTATIDAHVLPSITGIQPVARVKIDDWPIPSNIRLADQHFYILAELYLDLLSIGQIKIAEDLPYLQNTVLGWIVSGKITAKLNFSFYCNMATSIETKLDSQLDRFFKQEVIDSHRQERTVQENQCEAHFISTFQRTTSGRFCIKLPFSSPVNSLGDSKLIAKRRFLSLEKRFEHNCNLKSEYVEFMDDYKLRGHMSPVAETEVRSPNYFLPHHRVLKPDSSSTRLRVVFDASAQTTSGVSLNNLLMVGPVTKRSIQHPDQISISKIRL